MTGPEWRSTGSLASIVALRLLALFLILPVFAVHARHLPGGDQAWLVGLALGIYGLTQALLQLPYGMASDRWGRKPVIAVGLVIFVIGSVVAALATDVFTVVIGRALQGAGAVSAAVTALLADLTRPRHRTLAMAVVGIGAGLSFAVSLVVSPILYAQIGMAGIFWLTATLAAAALLVLWRVVPDPPPHGSGRGAAPAARLRLFGQGSEGVLGPALRPFYLGVFVLHAVQMALFVVVPNLLVEKLGWPVAEHWKLYLPVMLASFVLMAPLLGWGERRRRMSAVLRVAIALLVLAVAGLITEPRELVPLAVLLAVFFTGFNILEASQPSLVSRLAPVEARGSALGLYSTMQSIGLFVGGGLGGWLFARSGGQAVFVACAVLLVTWFVVALSTRMVTPEAREHALEDGGGLSEPLSTEGSSRA